MNIVVQRARHPQLREYIHSAVTGLLPAIQKGLMERVAVIFSNNENIALERFIFKLSVNPSYGSKVEEANLKFTLQSILIKLPISETVTKVLPRDCRWEITAYFRSLPQASTGKDAELWIPTDTGLKGTNEVYVKKIRLESCVEILEWGEVISEEGVLERGGESDYTTIILLNTKEPDMATRIEDLYKERTAGN